MAVTEGLRSTQKHLFFELMKKGFIGV